MLSIISLTLLTVAPQPILTLPFLDPCQSLMTCLTLNICPSWLSPVRLHVKNSSLLISLHTSHHNLSHLFLTIRYLLTLLNIYTLVGHSCLIISADIVFLQLKPLHNIWYDPPSIFEIKFCVNHKLCVLCPQPASTVTLSSGLKAMRQIGQVFISLFWVCTSRLFMRCVV